MSKSKNGAVPKDAIIFIPGIGGHFIDQFLEGMAKRIATALDRNAKSEKATFAVTEEKLESYGSGQKTRVRTIQRIDAEKVTAELDVWEFDYTDTITKKFESHNLFVKSWLTLLAIITKIGIFYRAFIKAKDDDSGLSRTEMIQLLYASAVNMLLIVYVFLLIAAVVTTVFDFDMKVYFQPLIIILTGIGLFTPAVKEFLTKAAVDYLSIIYYLDMGERKNIIVGHLANLMEHLAEKKSLKYNSIHLVSFSFGSIVAMDCLFPKGVKPTRRMENIDSFVTIGCPFDFIRTFWPTYFDNREAIEGTPDKWLNIHSPLDVLSSNFRNDSKNEKADRAVRLSDPMIKPAIPENIVYNLGPDADDLSWLGILTFIGIKAHSMYWEKEYSSEMTCFTEIVKRLYPKNKLLS